MYWKERKLPLSIDFDELEKEKKKLLLFLRYILGIRSSKATMFDK